VNKPSGVVVHPSSGNWFGTLLNGVLAHLQTYNEINGRHQANVYPGLVHRLDKETSGVMVIAKTVQAHRALSSQFEDHTIVRTYEALVHGKPVKDQGTIHLAIGRDLIDGKKVSSNSTKAQAAATEFNVLQTFGNVASRIELIPHTGRQHQLRVHLASLGCPIWGDQLYGGQKVCGMEGIPIPRMMLHAKQLQFRHPVSKQWAEFSSKYPPEMERVVEKLVGQFV
jgi:23S rRNA pseudouridine1911/1915/1917 synthase